VDLARIVVLLEPVDGRGAARWKPVHSEAEPAVIESRSSAFQPSFDAVRAGQPLMFSNHGPLRHRLFSTELGSRVRVELAPRRRSEPIRLPAGAIRFFCSLHPDENFVVFSSPTDHFALPDHTGAYRFSTVPEGRYLLSIWSELVEGPVRQIVVTSSGVSRERIWINLDLIDR
jgi:hypothetical protein